MQAPSSPDQQIAMPPSRLLIGDRYSRRDEQRPATPQTRPKRPATCIRLLCCQRTAPPLSVTPWNFTIDPHDGQAEAINIGDEFLIDSTNGDNQATNDNRNTIHVDVNLDRSTDHIDIQPSEDSSFEPDILIQDIGILLLVLKLKF
ncbi:hypothetical protein EJB05_26375, partial [Eragrostis curvula]